MWKLLFTASVVLSTSYALGGQYERFLATISTVSTTSYLTTWDTCTFSTSCAVVPADATVCRRRRGGHSIEDVKPSAPVTLEHTETAALKSRQLVARLPSLESSVQDERVQLDIEGFPDGCAAYLPRNFGNLLTGFGITIFVTSTITSSTTCATSTTKTNTFNIVGCSPSGIVTCTSAAG